jgi:hypothetical protein
MGNLILLLKDKVVIGKLPENISLDGKVGLYAWGGGKTIPHFTEITVNEQDSSQIKVLGKL